MALGRPSVPGYQSVSSVFSGQRKLFFIGGGLFALFLVFMLFFSWERVEGNERLVTQNWRTGVNPDLISAGTFFYVPLFTTTYKYNVGTEKFIMGRADLYNGKGSDSVDYPPYTITTGGNGKEQPATFSVTMQYVLDPSKLVDLHKTAQGNYEDLVIKPALTRIISDMATTQTVLDFYSGEGRVSLQRNIEQAITNHPALSSVGIKVETFVIDSIDLDKAYVEEITGRQLATQKKLRAVEEAKAAEEVAKKVEAEAQADKLKKIVEAEAAKEQKIKAAEATAAETKLAAEASRFQKEQDAKGLLAQGSAQAQVDEMKRTAKYAGESGRLQAEVEIAVARTEMFKNMKIEGVVPEKTLLTFIKGGSPLLTTPTSTADTAATTAPAAAVAETKKKK